MRSFQVGEIVTLECQALCEEKRIRGAVVLVSTNQAALCFGFENPVGLWSRGGLVVCSNIGIGQDEAGTLTDLFGNSWSVV